MKIIVSPLSHVMDMVARYAPERIVSLLDPAFAFPETGSAYLGRHLCLHFHDINGAVDGWIAPTAEHVDHLLAFLAAWTKNAPLLIHCHAGISRSPATAFIAACLHNPSVDELEIALALRRASTLVRPNGTLVKLADAAMGRNGRMQNALIESGRNLPWIEAFENEPFEMPGVFGSAFEIK